MPTLKRCLQLVKQPLVALALSTTILVVTASKVQASVIFDRAEKALACLIKIAYDGELQNSLDNIPFFLFTSLDVLLFVLMLTAFAKIFTALKEGEEIGYLIKTPVSIMAIVSLVILFQQVFISETCPVP